MFPRLAHLAMQEVRGLRFEDQALPLPGCPEPSSQTQPARRQQRSADHVLEDRAVFVPTNRSIRLIFRNQRMFERRSFDAGELGRKSEIVIDCDPSRLSCAG